MYDSDFWVGAFVQDGFDEEAFVCMDEEALKKHKPILLPAAKTKNSDVVCDAAVEPEVPELIDETIHAMKVAELRGELGRRGMSKNGLKAVLHDCLKEAVVEKVS